MSRMLDDSIDLVVTSPPYDNLRAYNDSVDLSWGETVWKPIIGELARVIKDGGVIVWIVNDATIDGSETGTSFRQALYAIDRGLRLHDTMIWVKRGGGAIGGRYTYTQNTEYMFIFSKGRPSTFNPIKDLLNASAGSRRYSMKGARSLKQGGEMTGKFTIVRAYHKRDNWWICQPAGGREAELGHTAIFPEQLAHDHIVSWSNRDDIVYDPFAGSGTTCAVAAQFGRRYIGSEISEEYTGMARARIAKYTGEGVSKPAEDLDLFNWREKT